MDLYFLRHGRAVEPDAWRGEEHARPLTAEGRTEMRTVAQGIRQLNLKLTALYSSQLARARETAQSVGELLSLPVSETETLAPGCDLERLAPLLAAQPAKAAILLVGHEPDLSMMIGQLITGRGVAHVSMKKASCCHVSLVGDGSVTPSLAGRGELRWLLTAKQLSRLAG